MKKVKAYLETTIVREIEVTIENNFKGEALHDYVFDYIANSYDWDHDDEVHESSQIYKISDYNTGLEVWHESELSDPIEEQA